MFKNKVTNELVEQTRLERWIRRYPHNLVWTGFVFVNGFIAVAVLSVLALLFHMPLIFPSVGPTAFLLYYKPLSPNASPRNALWGHAIGICCGYAALCLTGLQHAPAANLEDVHWPRVLAAALSLAATGALMVLFRVVHPPAGATTLIISLGFITAPVQLLVIEIAVLLMLVQAFVVLRLVGIRYPVWYESS